MAADYIIKTYYPDDEESMINIRKKMGYAYMKFIEEYIMGLSIVDEDKNNLYLKVLKELE